MNKKGWISTIFLIYFVVISTWIGILEYQTQSQIKVMMNMKEATQRLLEESRVVDIVFCDYLNGSFSEEVNQSPSLGYEVIRNNEFLIVQYNGYQIAIEIDEKGKSLVDYRIIRAE